MDRALVALAEAHGFTPTVRPATPDDGEVHGGTDYGTRTVWVNGDCGQAERVRILAHETAGHLRCDHAHRRDISQAQRETEAALYTEARLHEWRLEDQAERAVPVAGRRCPQRRWGSQDGGRSDHPAVPQLGTSHCLGQTAHPSHRVPAVSVRDEHYSDWHIV
jgi:hypothetical protein